MGTELGLSHYWDTVHGWHLNTACRRPNEEEVTTMGWKKCHNEELHNLHS
jgi:hypothetical protein